MAETRLLKCQQSGFKFNITKFFEELLTTDKVDFRIIL